jgi:CheY-like chemotaxis protein
MHVHGIKALVVDDNPVNCKVISRSMGYYGLEVETAPGGPEAIAMCRSNSYDLIFMDQMMPEMDGIETLQQIRRLNSYYADPASCRIIVLTANAISGVREELMAKGFDEYLSKPINFRSLEAVLQKFLPPEAFDDEAESIPDAPIPEAVLSELLPDVHIVDGIFHCGGRISDYLEVLQLMYDSSDRQLQQLQQEASSKNWKDFAIYAHALKGSCLNIGAADCGEDARKLEQAGREEDQNYIAAHLDEFLEKYRNLMLELKQVLGRRILPENTASSSSSEKDSCPRILRDLAGALREFDFAQAGSFLEKAHAAPDAGDHAKQLARLDDLMDSMDVDGMLEVLAAQ